MKYDLRIGPRTLRVEFSPVDGQSGRMTVEEREYIVGYETQPGGGLRLTVNGRTLSAFVVPGEPGGKQIFVAGRTFLVQDVDREPRRRRAEQEAEPGDVTPPMPSLVVRILVEVGDEVEKGQDLVVVSAMKMETTLRAPFAGVVTRVNTTVGAKVCPGENLVEVGELEP